MKNQIRIVTTKRGYANIIRSLKSFCNQKIIDSVINENTCQVYGGLVFFKWDNSQHSKLIQTIMICLMSHRNSYKICKIEDSVVQTYCQEIEYKNLPIPVMDCKFKDEETIEKLKARTNRRKKGGQANECL